MQSLSKAAVLIGFVAVLSASSVDAKTENGTKDIDMAGTQGPGSGKFPVLAEGRSAGTLTGTIADNSLDLDRICATSESSFDFWSDGTDFASNRAVGRRWAVYYCTILQYRRHCNDDSSV